MIVIFKIEVKDIEVSTDASLLSQTRNYDNKNMISGVFVIENATNQIIFGEGTDADGYEYHQISFNGRDDLKVYSNENDLWLTTQLGNDIEVKDICGDYAKVKIKIMHFLIA